MQRGQDELLVIVDEKKGRETSKSKLVLLRALHFARTSCHMGEAALWKDQTWSLLSPSEDIRHQAQASATYPISQTLLLSLNLPIKYVVADRE